MMLIRMFKLRMLNAIAPAYFYIATAVTIVLHFFLFIPTIFQTSGVVLCPIMLLPTAIFLFLMLNALGNYSMTIWFPAESANENIIPVCSPDCPDRVDAHYLLNGRHFCKLCKKVIMKRDHHCFFTGNCIGNRNMRYFIMFSIYTSCTCLYSLVLGVAYLSVEYSISFENPLTFLTLLPLSTGYFFLGKLVVHSQQRLLIFPLKSSLIDSNMCQPPSVTIKPSYYILFSLMAAAKNRALLGYSVKTALSL